ncbi:MAG: hypothetical protein Q8R28_00810, partial [Dehalococcoidia bacterium]|nr:hypothetical protein [Dehalococcoidia bacterium]
VLVSGGDVLVGVDRRHATTFPKSPATPATTPFLPIHTPLLDRWQVGSSPATNLPPTCHHLPSPSTALGRLFAVLVAGEGGRSQL